MALWQKLREEKRAEVWSGRIVITILECTFPEENVNGACSGKKHHPAARMFWVVARAFHGPSYTIESQWGNFGTLLPPRGATFTPF